MNSRFDTIDDIIIKNGRYAIVSHNGLSVRRFEEQVSDMTLTFLQIRDKEIENTNIPSMAKVLYYQILVQQSVPSQEEFIGLYQNLHCDMQGDKFRLKDGFSLLSTKALEARLRRAWPSLLRDIHFYLLCLESGRFDEVVYSLQQDFIHGYDIMVKTGKKKIFARLSVNTASSRQWSKTKNSRHDYDNNEVSILLDLDGAKTCGDLKTYDDKHVQFLYNEVLAQHDEEGDC
jgi:hypothetical protein